MNNTAKTFCADLATRGLKHSEPKALGMGLVQVMVDHPADKPLLAFHQMVAASVQEAKLPGVAVNYVPSMPCNQIRVVWREDALPVAVEDEAAETKADTKADA